MRYFVRTYQCVREMVYGFPGIILGPIALPTNLKEFVTLVIQACAHDTLYHVFTWGAFR